MKYWKNTEEFWPSVSPRDLPVREFEILKITGLT
jgi:hypothetical protein